jgi:histidinol-phosphate aminotransferase
MPRHRHDASVDVRSIRRSAAASQLSRRTLIGGLLTAAGIAAVEATTAGRAAAATSAPAAAAPRTMPLRLGSNENPGGLGPSARQAFLAAADEANRYPGRAGQVLIDALAAHHGVEPTWILLAPGSGDLLRAATVAFTGGTRALIGAAPTFEAPARIAAAIGAPAHLVPVTADGALDLGAMAGKAEGAGLFFVCNPNNPTGAHVSATAVADFVARVKVAAPEAKVLVDEAYFEYVDDPGYATAVPLVKADPRVLVTRTFSKVFGMAGLRVGYAVAHPDTLAALRKQGSSGTLCSASLAAAAAALADTAHLGLERARNRDARRFAREQFEAAGYRVLPSSANFLMIDVRRDAGAFQALCRQHQMLVARPFPPLTTCVRLSIGTMAEMQEAVPALLGLLAAPAPVSARLAPSPFAPPLGGEC